jgi:hypothetical protein
MMHINVESLKSTFRLNGEGDIERYFKRKGWVRFSGRSSTDGYPVINWGGRMFRVHRLVFALATGVDPDPYQIDHINGNRSDNRIGNLRLATNRTNGQNQKCHRNGRMLPTGVAEYRYGFKVATKIDGHQYHLGSFKTPEEAGIVYLHATTLIDELRIIFKERY